MNLSSDLEWLTLTARVGDTSLDEEFEATAFTIGVAAIKQHPQYNGQTVQNDISVLELSEAVSLTEYPNIKPVCLPEAGALFPGEAIVSGWGTTSSGGHLTAFLNEVGVRVFPDGDCGSMTSMMSEDMICAGLMAGGKDSCQGDSGGPAVSLLPVPEYGEVRATLLGLTSWGYGCGKPNKPGVYTRLSQYVDWIHRRVTRNNNN